MLVAVIPHVMHEFVIFHEMNFRSHYTYAYANTIIRHERQSMHACNIPEVWSHGAIDNDHVLTASPIALWPYYYQWCPHKPVIRILQQPQRLSSSASLVGANYHDCSVNQACRARTTVSYSTHAYQSCYVSLPKQKIKTTVGPTNRLPAAYTPKQFKIRKSKPKESTFLTILALKFNGHQLGEIESASYRTAAFNNLQVSKANYNTW